MVYSPKISDPYRLHHMLDSTIYKSAYSEFHSKFQTKSLLSIF